MKSLSLKKMKFSLIVLIASMTCFSTAIAKPPKTTPVLQEQSRVISTKITDVSRCSMTYQDMRIHGGGIDTTSEFSIVKKETRQSWVIDQNGAFIPDTVVVTTQFLKPIKVTIYKNFLYSNLSKAQLLAIEDCEAQRSAYVSMIEQ